MEVTLMSFRPTPTCSAVIPFHPLLLSVLLSSLAAAGVVSSQQFTLNDIPYTAVIETATVKGQFSLTKYALSSSGARVDINAILRGELATARAKYGNLHTHLYDLLSSARDTDTFRVAFFPAAPSSRPHLPATREALLPFDLMEQSILYTLGTRNITYDNSRTNRQIGILCAYLSKADILQLAHLPTISAALLLDETPLPISPLMSTVYGAPVYGGVSISNFSAAGANASVAVLEPGRLDTNQVRSYMSTVPLTIRAGSRSNGGNFNDSHSVYVSSLIRNSRGDFYANTIGGAPYLQNMYFSTIGPSITSFLGAYYWAVDTSGVHVVNNSWQTNRWQSSTSDTAASVIDWLMDWFANNRGVLSIVAAGNGGYSTSGTSPYQQCIANSYNPTIWNATTCERCMHWGHNVLQVGSINDATNYQYVISSFTSWKNPPTNDEVPHVSINGAGVNFPWTGGGSFNGGSGTSY
jgi:hypothetical protein